MLVVTNKKYEIEEKIQLLDDKGDLAFEFDMKLTADDLKKLKEVMLNKDTLKLASKIQSLEKSELNDDQTDEVLDMADKMEEDTVNLISGLCFKDNKDKFIELGGQAKFEEMVEVISDYLLSFFIKKQSDRTNIINSDLAKITKK